MGPHCGKTDGGPDTNRLGVQHVIQIYIYTVCQINRLCILTSKIKMDLDWILCQTVYKIYEKNKNKIAV